MNSAFSVACDRGLTVVSGYLPPNRPRAVEQAFLDGNFARKSHSVRRSEYTIWDTELTGFGLRVRPGGRAFWTVRLRHRGKQRRITLGRAEDVDATVARAQARRLFAEVAIDGLPKRTSVQVTPTLSDYVETYWDDIARYWKPSTAKRNRDAWRRDLEPVFGTMRVAEVLPADVVRDASWVVLQAFMSPRVNSGLALIVALKPLLTPAFRLRRYHLLEYLGRFNT